MLHAWLRNTEILVRIACPVDRISDALVALIVRHLLGIDYPSLSRRGGAQCGDGADSLFIFWSPVALSVAKIADCWSHRESFARAPVVFGGASASPVIVKQLSGCDDVRSVGEFGSHVILEEQGEHVRHAGFVASVHIISSQSRSQWRTGEARCRAEWARWTCFSQSNTPCLVARISSAICGMSLLIDGPGTELDED